jgi:hypothetical protein
LRQSKLFSNKINAPYDDINDKINSPYDDINDDDWKIINQLALGDEHVKELSEKVEAAIQSDWDLKVISNKLCIQY